MLDTHLLLLFIPTCFVISISPGMCMTLAMTLGMSIGVKRTLYMMWGELIGVATVAVCAVLGVAALMLNYPEVFALFKWLGGAYLIFIGAQMWQSKGKLALDHTANQTQQSNLTLFLQGLITAIANPKGWAFTASLLPPFINPSMSLAPQLGSLVTILLLSEFLCMVIYASGGQSLKKLLANNANVMLVNKITGCLMIGVGIWLALG